jgi:hypothetical protein
MVTRSARSGRRWVLQTSSASIFCPEMIDLARKREIERCELGVGDVRSLEFDSGSFDVVLSQLRRPSRTSPRGTS